jgi:CheY-like chemotaxis protein
LVVDDELAIGKVLRIKLGLSGYDVTTTTSGAEAIELIKAKEPDIVLLDILMPDVTGMDVIENVRSSSRSADNRLHRPTGNLSIRREVSCERLHC